jgi:hypothetical protein
MASDEHWSTFVIQARGLHDKRLGANIPMKSISANRNNQDVKRMTDGRIDTAWSGGNNQIGDEEIRIDLGTEQSIGGIVFSMGAFSFGFPRYAQIAASSDQIEWRPAWSGRPAVNTVHAAVNDPDVVPLTIDVGDIKGRYIRIQQKGSAPGIPWWIAKLSVRAPASSNNEISRTADDIQRTTR